MVNLTIHLCFDALNDWNSHTKIPESWDMQCTTATYAPVPTATTTAITSTTTNVTLGDYALVDNAYIGKY